MKILAIDTSSKNASVAITKNEEKLIELNNADEKTHSQKLMPMIDEALKKADISLNEIDLISCCIGPGSFTGVRIGIATAKAFSDSRNIPVTGVNSLEELAYNLNTEGYICSLIDAGHGNTYTGLFRINKDQNGMLQTTKENLVFLNWNDEEGKISSNKLTTFLESNIVGTIEKPTIYFVGDATQIYKDILLENSNLKNKFEFKISNTSQNLSSGITLARIGYTRYKNGKYGNSSTLLPVYLRKSQAELALEEKKQ